MLRAAQPMAKIYAEAFDGRVRDFIPVFHRWIQRQRTGTLLVDVHDYSHVHEGPGIILVGHEAIYAMDLGEGRIGLAVKRRRGEPQAVEAALAEALAETARAAAFLEEDVPGLRFGTADLLVGFDDRLHAASAEAFFGDAGPDLTRLAERSFAAEGRVSPAFEPRGPFRARLEGQPLALSALRARLLA